MRGYFRGVSRQRLIKTSANIRIDGDGSTASEWFAARCKTRPAPIRLTHTSHTAGAAPVRINSPKYVPLKINLRAACTIQITSP